MSIQPVRISIPYNVPYGGFNSPKELPPVNISGTRKKKINLLPLIIIATIIILNK